MKLTVSAAVRGVAVLGLVVACSSRDATANMFDALGLDRVPGDELSKTCSGVFLGLNLGNAGSDHFVSEVLRSNLWQQCSMSVGQVFKRHGLDKNAQISVCNNLQQGVDSAQDQGQIAGSASFAQLFEAAAKGRTEQMSWDMFCERWYDQLHTDMLVTPPAKHRRMLNSGNTKFVQANKGKKHHHKKGHHHHHKKVDPSQSLKKAQPKVAPKAESHVEAPLDPDGFAKDLNLLETGWGHSVESNVERHKHLHTTRHLKHAAHRHNHKGHHVEDHVEVAVPSFLQRRAHHKHKKHAHHSIEQRHGLEHSHKHAHKHDHKHARKHKRQKDSHQVDV